VTACLSLFITINFLTVLSLIAMGGGLYFFFTGFHLLARKRLLLGTPSSKIRSAALGLVEVNGVAVGPHTIAAPITGKPCFLYHTTVWQQRKGEKDSTKEGWEKVADETLHLPFFVDDSTGQLLIEPLGADLDLHRDFHERYDASFFSMDLEDVPARVNVFLSRHGISPVRRSRIEEWSIKPQDPLFIAGTLTENPGVQVRPASRHIDSTREKASLCSPPNDFSGQSNAPQIIRLHSGTAPSSTREMSQQAKIAAALTRAGIVKPEAWAAAGVPYQALAVEESTLPVVPADSTLTGAPSFDLTPPVVMMKGANDPMFVISYRSQKEFARALGWKSSTMIWGGAAILLLGAYVLIAQMV
jgi:E3 Ubiquitin ligase